MTDAETPDNDMADTEPIPNEIPAVDGETTEPAAAADESGGRRDWILPAALFGGLIALLIVFGVGFLVGRATSSDATAAGDHVVVQMGDVPQNGQPVPGDRFRFRAPGGRFSLPDLGQLGNLDELPQRMLDRLCTFLDQGNLPQDTPFLDQLTQLCSNTGTGTGA